MKRLFYDAVYSEDDGGWYCQVYDKKGHDVYETSVHPNRPEAVAEVHIKHPQAEHRKDL